MLIQSNTSNPHELARHEASKFKPGRIPDRLPRRIYLYYTATIYILLNSLIQVMKINNVMKPNIILEHSKPAIVIFGATKVL